VRAGLYGGGKDKSTSLASLTQSSSGVVEVARRLSCGKGAFEACAAAASTTAPNGTGDAVPGQACVSPRRASSRLLVTALVLVLVLFTAPAHARCASTGERGLQKPGENRNRKVKHSVPTRVCRKIRQAQSSQALKGWSRPATGRAVEHV
jgi:hypothetical protein